MFVSGSGGFSSGDEPIFEKIGDVPPVAPGGVAVPQVLTVEKSGDSSGFDRAACQELIAKIVSDGIDLQFFEHCIETKSNLRSGSDEYNVWRECVAEGWAQVAAREALEKKEKRRGR